MTESYHFCSRCKEARPTEEWTYVPAHHAWRHDRMLRDLLDGSLHRCNWLEHIVVIAAKE